jgi:hypothetical protein
MTSAETPPTAPAAPPAPKAYRSQAGHYDRRTDASSSGVNCSSRRCLSGPGIPSVAADCGTGLCAPLLHRQVGLLLAHHPPASMGENIRRDQPVRARADHHRIRRPAVALCHVDPLPRHTRYQPVGEGDGHAYDPVWAPVDRVGHRAGAGARYPGAGCRGRSEDQRRRRRVDPGDRVQPRPPGSGRS